MNPLSTEPGKLTELPGQTVPYVLAAGGGRAHLLIDQVGRCLGGCRGDRRRVSMMTLDGPAGRADPAALPSPGVRVLLLPPRQRAAVARRREPPPVAPATSALRRPTPSTPTALPGHHSGFMGPIIPGGWDRFFDLTGIPYSGDAPFPVGFRPEIPFAKFGQAEHDFDMKYLPEAEYAAPRADATDDALPGACAAVLPSPRRRPPPSRRRHAGDLAVHRRRDRRRSEHVHRRAAARRRRPRARAREDHRGHLRARGRAAAYARRRRVLAAPGATTRRSRPAPRTAGRARRSSPSSLSMSTPGGLEAALDAHRRGD